MTGVFVNQNYRWNRIDFPHVNVEGVWYTCKNVFVKQADQWHLVWSFKAQFLTVPVTKEIHDVRTCAA